MLDITIRVTKSSVHLEQIHQITAQNIANIKDDLCEYNVYLDGKHIGQVRHHQKDGALELTRLVMQYIASRLDL